VAVKIAEIITNEHTRQLEAIMEKQMKTGAERASYIARKTLSKVHKKLGFVQI
jgi:hypothetical protein